MKSLLQLIGAGPGDPDLITVKAIKAIENADVILYDALANETLLRYAKKAKVKRFVGKRYGCHALSQAEINHLIIEYAANYQKIIRLKGGDPFVFGRAIEEIETAKTHGIAVEIIPGISSANAVPASVMIPLTARGISEGFWVTTGTTRSGTVSEDIRLAAQSNSTVVILMAMSKLEEIMDIFSSFGKDKTPVAIIQNGTTPNAKMITGTVRDITWKAQHADLSNPAIIVVGEVVKLHHQLVQAVVSEQVSAVKSLRA